jgi:amino acid adenylation domain-containing protein
MLQENIKNSKESADALIAWIREYAALHIDSCLADERGCFPPHVFLDLGNQGFFGMHVPKSYGGLGLTTYDLLRVIEQVAAIDLTLTTLLIEAVQGAHTLEKYASESFKNRYLPQLASGRILVGGAMTESAAGSNPRAMKATAKPDGKNGWLLRGDKRWVGMGAWAHLIAVYVQEFDAKDNWVGMSGFFVLQGSKGLRMGAETQTMGIRAIAKHSIYLEDVSVGKEELLGRSGQGMEIAQDNMMYIRLCLAAANIGAMKRSAQLMYRYAERRTIATGKLVENPITILCLSEMTAMIHGIENLVYLLAKALDENPKNVPEEALVAVKILASEYAGWTVDKLVQMLGARGYEESSGISQLFRDARTFRIFEGPTEALTMYIGARMFSPNPCFQNFLCETVQQKKIVDEINTTIEKIVQHYRTHKADFFTKPFLMDYWIQAAIGNVISHGILLAIAEYSAQKDFSENNKRTLAWVREKFNIIVEKSFTCSPAEKVLIQSDKLKVLVSNYATTVGDIEQTRISQQTYIDPLLKSHFDVSHEDDSQTISPIEEVSPTTLLADEGKVDNKPYTLSEKERQQLAQWTTVEKNRTYPDICVHALFEAQAAKTPESIAIVYHKKVLTYRELNVQANQLAHYLIKKGVSSGEAVAICLERSLAMIVGVLAILKAGGAYVSLDPHYPPERLEYMLQDSGAEIVLTQKKLAGQIYFKDKACILMDETEKLLVLESEQNPAAILKTQSLAYIIYTSGSTGKPKGVMLPHKALTNLVCWQKEKIKEKRNILQFTTLSFDMSFLEIFSALSAGGTLTLISEEERLDIFTFSKIIKKYAVEQLILPVPFLRRLAEFKGDAKYFETLKEIIAAGEQLTLNADIRAFFKKLPGCKLLNYYGPSETHVVSVYELPSDPENWPTYVPIGRPITHAKIEILDENLQSLPIGVPGELYVGGVSLARGYKNNDALTKEKFITDMYAEDSDGKLYRTGDFAKYLPDGNIVFIGRKDDQVKISGFRVELQEVEAHLSQYLGIKDAVVLVKTNAMMEKYIEAFFVTDSVVNSQYVEQLRSFLKKRLPNYMLPAVFNSIHQMPLTPSGKIDKIALEKMTSSMPIFVAAAQEQKTDTEKKLLDIFEDFFKVRPSINHGFSAIGGNSLLAMSVVSRLHDQFSVEVPACAILSDPTISDIAKRIDALKRLQ